MLTNAVFKFCAARTNGINLNCAIERERKKKKAGVAWAILESSCLLAFTFSWVNSEETNKQKTKPLQ